MISQTKNYQRKVFWFFYAGVIVFRLFLTSDRDILEFNQPYDDYWFIKTAKHWIWAENYNQLSFAQLQLYSIWLKLISLLGIPARLATAAPRKVLEKIQRTSLSIVC